MTIEGISKFQIIMKGFKAMKKKLSLLLCLCLIICSFSFSVKADDDKTNETSSSYIEDEVIVLTNVYYDKDDYSEAETYFFNGISIVSISPLFDDSTSDLLNSWIQIVGNTFPYLIKLDSSWSVDLAIDTLESNVNVVMANRNYVIINDNQEDLVSVTYVSNERSISESGTDYEQWCHEYLQIDSIWSKGFVGTSDTVVGIIDSGFVTHSDLENNLNMSLAYDAWNGGTDVSGGDHGTAVAGVIGADYNDGGIDGICQSVTMIPIQMAGNSASSRYDNMCRGITYAIQHNAKVVNISQYFSFDTSELTQLAEDAGILIVAAAGNNQTDIDNVDPTFIDENGYYDGALGLMNDSPNWIVVGGINSNETIYSNSNYGKRYCDIFAPGSGIYTTNADGYAYINGTSFSAPYVTAACALIMSKATHLTPLEVKALLMDNVKEIEGFDDLCVSGGVLSISNAVGALFSEPRAAYEKGDVSGDGQITAADYLMCKQIVFSSIDYTDEQFNAADVNNDGNVTAVDYMMIQKFINQTYYFPPR